MSNLKGKEYKRFESIKHVRTDGGEYWSARELAPALEYVKWENFSKVIKRAMIACENSGHSIEHDFPEVRKVVEAGATSKPKRDYELTRYACYLIVQNGDPRKEVIALGQTYFAIQTYRQEYGLIFPVAREKLGVSGTGDVDILNVKCDPEMGIHMRKQDGILPAYHMNHAQWLSILLDGTVPLKTVCNLLDISYELTLSKKKRRKRVE
ncbi:MAG: MmcQ/YjbR family DNA-binding protein [Lachnospiraceae bacterium]|nr:MmcQ/YjbR family DNA-binding protein [Lachnospiraceae bacterium]